MKRLLIIFVLSFIHIVFAQQEDNFYFFSQTGGFFTYEVFAGLSFVDEDEAAIYGSTVKTRSNKTDTLATKRAPVRYMVWWYGSEDPDSLSGNSLYLTNLVEETEYTYYHSIFVQATDGDTDYYKGADSTLTTGLVSGLFTFEGDAVLYSSDSYRIYAKEEE